jgi:TRAP-type C4-dicarboxylate transport system substrate-binding protein
MPRRDEMKNLLFVLLVAILLVAAMVANGYAAASAPDFTLKWAEYAPPADVRFVSFNHFIERIGEVTKGRVKIEMYPSETIAKTRDIFDALMGGRIDMTGFATTYYVGKMPALALYDAPYILTSHPGEAILMCSRGEHVRLLDEEFAKFNIKFLGWTIESPSGTLVVRDRLVKEPKDLQGLKIRAPGPLQAKMLTLWGAVPVSIPRPEVYMAIQTRVVDGGHYAISAAASDRAWEVASYVTDTSVPMGAMPVCINKKVWDGFPDDIKKAFQEVSKEMPPFAVEVQDKYIKETRALFKEKFKGVYVVEPGSAAFDAFWNPVKTQLIPSLLKGLGPRYEEWYKLILKSQQEVIAEKKW